MKNLNQDFSNSTYCRLCCVDSGKNGLFIYGGNSTENISSIINKYLPIKVSELTSILFDFELILVVPIGTAKYQIELGLQ